MVKPGFWAWVAPKGPFDWGLVGLVSLVAFVAASWATAGSPVSGALANPLVPVLSCGSEKPVYVRQYCRKLPVFASAADDD